MMRILIVGSKGFIGSHALRELGVMRDCKVYGCDVVTDYTSRDYFQIDATNPDYHELFEGAKFDVCINCSGAASVPDSFVQTYRDYSLNTVNVFKLLDAIKKYAPLCKFINLSSAAVYGNPASLPIKEDAVCNPLSPYGFHKQQAEMTCREFNHFYGLRTCSLRIFSAYGEGLKKQIFWDLAKKAHDNAHSISLFGTGRESRDFIHVLDIVRVIWLITQHSAFSGDCYNVANGIEVTIVEAAFTLLKQLQWDGKLEFLGASRTGDPLNWLADISKIEELGYKPAYTMTGGLKQYVSWLQKETLL
jgi:UDP-glucose 4-epimerase